MVAALLSQLGMAVVVKLGGTYRPVTIKSTALIIAVSLFATAVTVVWYEVFGKKGTVNYILAALCLLITIHSFFFPIEKVYYRYPSLAAILAVVLTAVPAVMGKHERENAPLFEVKLSHENVFLLCVLIAGALFALRLPVSSYNSWDDDTHYERVVYMSQGIYATRTEADTDLIYSPFFEVDDEEALAFAHRLDIEEKNPGWVVAYNSARTFHPDRIGYLGTLALYWIGRVLGVPFSVRYILGRFGNLLLYSAIMYFAIRHAGKGKTLLTVLALGPAIVFMSANYSEDPWVFALCSVSFMIFFRACDESDRKLTTREIVIMVGAMVLGILPKLPYAFLLLFLLLMPREKFEDTKQMRNYWILIIICGLAIFAFTYALSFGMGDIGDNREKTEVVSGLGQIQYILSDFGRYLKMTFSFILEYLNPKQSGEVLTYMGLLGQGKGTAVYLAAIVFAILIDSPSSKIYIRIAGTVILIAMSLLLSLVFYLVFTPVGKDYVMGCQPRYLLPMIFPSAVLAFGGLLKIEKKWVQWVPIAMTAVVLAINVAEVVI